MTPTAPMIIRPVRHSDLTSVISLINREIRGGVNIFRLVPLDEIAVQRWWNLHGEGRYQALVAERTCRGDSGYPSGPQFAGWATFTPHSAYEGYDRTAELSVWVEPEARRSGCGRGLVEALLEKCSQRNFRTVISRIESNNVASIRLHLACGFTQVGLLEDVGEKLGQSLSVILMQFHAERSHPPIPAEQRSCDR